jgi:hypothetical protein
MGVRAALQSDGQCFNTAALCGGRGFGFLPNGNVVKQNLSFYE